MRTNTQPQATSCIYCPPDVTTKSSQATRPVAAGPVVSAAEAVPEKESIVGGPIAAFADWSKRYLAAAATERDHLVPEGIKLAEARRPQMRELIKDNPREALANAVPMVVRQQLPSSILGWLERRVNRRGAVMVYQGVPPPGQVLLHGKTLTHRIATLGSEGAFNMYPAGDLPLKPKPGEPDPNLLPWPDRPLNGIVIDREFAANSEPLRVLEVGEVPDHAKKAVMNCPISGKQTLAASEVDQPVTPEQAETVVETPDEIIYLCGGYHKTQLTETLLYGEGATGGPVTLSGALPAPPTPAIGQLKVLYIPMSFQDQVQNNNLPTESKCYEIMRNVADYYSKSSFGKLTTLTTVTPPIRLPKNEAWYVQRDSSNGGDIDGLGLEMAHAREEARRIGFDYNNYDVTVLRLIGGARPTGGWGGGSTVWVYGDSVGVTAHEIGHAFGLAHANFWDTAGTSAIGPGANAEYGDSYDVMGGGGVPTDHYNAAAKVQVKWMPSNFVQNITSSGLYRLHAFDQPILDPRNRYALTITKDSQHTYWGELRQLYTGNAARPWVDQGMILGWKYSSGGGGNIQLIDTTPGSPYNKDDAPIALGQTFADTEAGIYITTVGVSSTTPKYVDVLVNIGDFSSNHAPTLTLSASSTVVPVSSTVTFTANATDPDGDTLAYQWQHWGDTGVKLVSPNSPTITRTFSATAGNYVVSCTVSDMKGGSATRTILITTGNGGSKYTISGRITSGGVGMRNVLLTANGVNPTITDSDGYYTIANLAANTYSVTPALYGYTFGELFNNTITVGPNFAGADFEADGLPVVSITAPDAVALENSGTDNGTFRLTRTGDMSLPLVVNVNPATGTSATSDYTLTPALASGSGGFSTFTIPADSATLDIALTTPTADTAVEGPETVTFALGAGSGYLIAPNAGSTTIVIEDNETVTGSPPYTTTLPQVRVQATTDTADEGTASSGVFTVTRTGATTNALTVNFAVAGTATTAVDYAAIGTNVSIPAGASSATVNVTPIADTLVESVETISVTLSSNAAYVISPTASSATVSLFDDDTNVVSVVATDATAQEVDMSAVGAVANTGTFVVTRTGDLSSPLTVYYAVAGNPSSGVPALNGADFEPLPGVLQIPAGRPSASISIVPRWDGIGETPEQVLLQLGAGPTNYKLGSSNSATITINDGAGNLPYVELAAVTMAVEGGASGLIRFSLKGSDSGTVAIPFALTGTATRITDYNVTLPTSPTGSTYDSASGTGTIVMNATSGATAATVDLTLVPVNDTDLEDIEGIVCSITANSVVTTFGPTSSASIWLRDNDQPTVWADAQIGSGGGVRITEAATTSPFKFYVSRTGSTAAALDVNFSLQGTATPGAALPADYSVTTSATLTFDDVTRSGVLTIPAGASGANLTLSQTGMDDSSPEGTETIVFHAEAGSYSKTLDATIYVDDNDTGTQTVQFSATGAAGPESTTTVEVPVTLASPSTGTTSVEYVIDTGSRASTATANASIALPYWVRVTRAGAVHTSYISVDGVTWTTLSSARSPTTNTSAYVVGLVAASSASGTSCTATLDNVSVTGLDVGATISSTPTFGSIGTTNPASTSSEAGGVFTLVAGGTGLSTNGATDTACFVSYAVTNSVNCTVTARVVSISGGTNTSNAGVTIRQTTANNVSHVSTLMEKTAIARQTYRLPATGNAASATSTLTNVRPYWIKLQRAGDVFSGWSSPDGTTWVQTSTNRTIPMGLDVQAGLAVSAKSDGSLHTATFDNVSINGVAASGLTGRTIGYVNAQGSDSLNSGVYTVVGSGQQIGSTEDECHFVAKTITGDFTIMARVLTQSGGATTAQAGIMAREMHNYRSLSAYCGLVSNAMSEFVTRSTSVTTAFGFGVDYTLPTGTLTFNDLEQTKNITLTINDDLIAEPNESITLVLRSPANAILGPSSTFTYVIDDDDTGPALPYIGFAQTLSSAVEATAGSQSIAVSLSTPVTSDVTVDYTISGTATSDVDFTLASGTLTLAPGDTVASIPLVVLDDSDVESGETVVITLANPVGAALSTQSTHTFTITDDDLPVVSIVATDANAAEAGLDPGVFTVSRTGPTTNALVVSLTRTGTAVSGTDFGAIATPLSLTIPAGSSSATVTVTPINDSTNEGNETVIETVSSNAAYVVGSPSTATVTIADDDRSTVTISATDPEASETPGNTATFTVTRTAPTTGTLSVAFTVSGSATSGSDFTALVSPLSFAANESSKTITVSPINDTASEGDETVLVQLSAGSYTLGGAGYDEIVIHDNDFAPTITIDSPSANGALVASGQGIVVSASATDDGLPAALVTTWSQVSGPGTATISTPNALSSNVTFSADGVYVLKFTASDTLFTVSDQVTVVVGSAVAATDWIAQDMSPTTQQRGQSARVGGSYVLTGMGAGYATVTNDGAHIMARQVTGDGSIVARLTTLGGPAATPLAGVTIRDSLNRSVNRAVLGYSGGALQFRTRTTVSTADTVVTQAGISLPIWVKLDRVSASNTITASYSSDGSNWTAIGTPTVVSMINTTAELGVTATGNSGTAGQLCTATFDNITLTPAPSGPALVSEDFGTSPSTQATFAFDGTTYTVAATGGLDGSGAFYGWQYSGDLVVTAKLTDATSGALNALSGIEIRESMDNGAYAHLGRIPTGSFSGYIWRSVAGGSGGGVPSFTGKIRWMRLVRQGNSITAFHAADSGGVPGTWAQLGSPRTIIMSPNVLVGFAVDNAGGTAGVLNTAKFSNITVVPLNKAPVITVAVVGDVSPVSFDGTVTDDNFPLPVSLTSQWSQVGGPDTIVFGNVSAADTTGSFTASGSYAVRLQASDSGVVSFRDLSFTAYSQPFAKWLDQNNVGNEANLLSEGNLDADGDGLVNLLEYAAGTNGTVRNTSPEVVELTSVSTEKYLRLSMPRNPAATDVLMTVEATSDPGNEASWSSVGLVTEVNTSNQLVVRDNVPVGPGVKRFMRVRLTPQ